MDLDLRPEEARLLLNIALMAAGGNRFRSAAKIIAALEAYRPDSPAVPAAKAVALISAMQFGECLEYLDGCALKKFPHDPMLSAFKGMALIRLGRDSDAKPVLEEVARQDKDEAAANLAKGMLND